MRRMCRSHIWFKQHVWPCTWWTDAQHSTYMVHTRNTRWKEVGPNLLKGIRLYCICAHSPREKANAWSKIGKMHSCGLPLEQKGYHCLDPSTWKVHVSWDVVFDESTSWFEPDSAPSKPIEEELDTNSDLSLFVCFFLRKKRRYHCLFKPGFSPRHKVMEYENQCA